VQWAGVDLRVATRAAPVEETEAKAEAKVEAEANHGKTEAKVEVEANHGKTEVGAEVAAKIKMVDRIGQRTMAPRA